jgi:hypothetical protein
MQLKENIYVIYDAKAKVYTQPFYALNDNVALRIGMDLANQKDSGFSSHPEDYSLFRIGIYDALNAHIEMTKQECLAKLHHLVVDVLPDDSSVTDKVK